MVIEPAPSISKGVSRAPEDYSMTLLAYPNHVTRGYLWIILSMSFLSRDSAEFPGPDPINQ